MRGLHAEVERLLAAATVDVVVLRPGMFASNARPRAPEWLLLVTFLWPLTVAVITLVWLSRRDNS